MPSTTPRMAVVRPTSAPFDVPRFDSFDRDPGIRGRNWRRHTRAKDPRATTARETTPVDNKTVAVTKKKGRSKREAPLPPRIPPKNELVPEDVKILSNGDEDAGLADANGKAGARCQSVSSSSIKAKDNKWKRSFSWRWPIRKRRDKDQLPAVAGNARGAREKNAPPVGGDLNANTIRGRSDAEQNYRDNWLNLERSVVVSRQLEGSDGMSREVISREAISTDPLRQETGGQLHGAFREFEKRRNRNKRQAPLIPRMAPKTVDRPGEEVFTRINPLCTGPDPVHADHMVSSSSLPPEVDQPENVGSATSAVTKPLAPPPLPPPLSVRMLPQEDTSRAASAFLPSTPAPPAPPPLPVGIPQEQNTSRISSSAPPGPSVPAPPTPPPLPVGIPQEQNTSRISSSAPLGPPVPAPPPPPPLPVEVFPQRNTSRTFSTHPPPPSVLLPPPPPPLPPDISMLPSLICRDQTPKVSESRPEIRTPSPDYMGESNSEPFMADLRSELQQAIKERALRISRQRANDGPNGSDGLASSVPSDHSPEGVIDSGTPAGNGDLRAGPNTSESTASRKDPGCGATNVSGVNENKVAASATPSTSGMQGAPYHHLQTDPNQEPLAGGRQIPQAMLVHRTEPVSGRAGITEELRRVFKRREFRQQQTPAVAQTDGQDDHSAAVSFKQVPHPNDEKTPIRPVGGAADHSGDHLELASRRQPLKRTPVGCKDDGEYVWTPADDLSDDDNDDAPSGMPTSRAADYYEVNWIQVAAYTSGRRASLKTTPYSPNGLLGDSGRRLFGSPRVHLGGKGARVGSRTASGDGGGGGGGWFLSPSTAYGLSTDSVTTRCYFEAKHVRAQAVGDESGPKAKPVAGDTSSGHTAAAVTGPVHCGCVAESKQPSLFSSAVSRTQSGGGLLKQTETCFSIEQRLMAPARPTSEMTSSHPEGVKPTTTSGDDASRDESVQTTKVVQALDSDSCHLISGEESSGTGYSQEQREISEG